MNNVLQINTSLFGDNGQSSILSDQFVETLKVQHPQLQVTRRDLAADPIPHLDAATFTAAVTPESERSPEQVAAAALADQLIGELEAADLVVLGIPMYNFTVPSAFKAWTDHVARAGRTFRYTESGPRGLLDGAKKVIVFATRGGLYANTENDHQAPYIQQFFGLLNLTDIEFIYAEGLAMGEDNKTSAMAAAKETILKLAA